MKRTVLCAVLLLLAGGLLTLAACVAPDGGAPTVAPDETPTVSETVDIPPCDLEPVTVPTLPATIPKYAQLDETTGLHVTGTVPEIDFESWRLRVEGNVSRPLSLTYDQLRCLERTEAKPILICPGFFQDEANWAGVPISAVLELAGASAGRRILMYGADGYSQSISMEQAMSRSSLLAYEWEGQTLPMLHGFPLRAVLPEVNGNYWVKWIYLIEVY